MSIAKTLMLAAAMTVTAFAFANPAPGTSIATATAESQTVTAPPVTLDAAEMQAVQGDGFWKKLWRAIKRIVIIIINRPPCQTAPCPYPPPPPPPLPPVIEGEEVVFDANLGGDLIETFDRDVTVNEYYDDDVAFYEGRLSSRSETSSGYVFTGSSGGGGGSTCIDPSGPGCEYMY